MPIRSHGVTDVGKKRDHNEDAFFISDKFGLYIVADGMGGHAAGEVASAKAVEVIRDFVRRCQDDTEFTWPYGINPELNDMANTLVTAIKLANREVWRIAQEKAEHQGMGTTIVAVLVNGDQAAIAHVGDSRVYLVREGSITQKTRDHSWVNEQLIRGIISPEEAKNHRWKNVITRALGNKEQIEVDVSMHEMKVGDILFLCSDGMCLGDGVEEEDSLKIIVDHINDLKTAGQLLIGQANDAGGKDNITTVLVKSYATEEEADAEMKDRSDEDTNPLAVRSIAPPGMELDHTAEVDAAAILRSNDDDDSDNRLDEPIEFDEDDSTPPLGTKPVAADEEDDDDHADMSLGDVFEADAADVLGEELSGDEADAVEADQEEAAGDEDAEDAAEAEAAEKAEDAEDEEAKKDA